MSAIGGKNTKPELIVRKGLHAAGFRYRLHVKDLPGKPDLVLPKYQTVIFVHGCFWHRHDCPLFVWPKTRRTFWEDKILRNAERDSAALLSLAQAGWRTGIVWECAVKGRYRKQQGVVTAELAGFLKSDEATIEISGDYSR